jgi:Protein of unknown function (DUF3224)
VGYSIGSGSFAMTLHAAGAFEVKTTPLPPDESVAETSIGRFALRKTFHGDLAATSIGLMLAAGSLASGSAGYVAIEEITGTLNGRSGSFALQHNGVMSGGSFDLAVEVVPGSGTGDLEGIVGKMKILITGTAHSYSFDYQLKSA